MEIWFGLVELVELVELVRVVRTLKYRVQRETHHRGRECVRDEGYETGWILYS